MKKWLIIKMAKMVLPHIVQVQDERRINDSDENMEYKFIDIKTMLLFGPTGYSIYLAKLSKE